MEVYSFKHEIQYGMKFFLYDHSTQQSFFVMYNVYLEMRGKEGGSELDIIADTSKAIARHKLVDKK